MATAVLPDIDTERRAVAPWWHTAVLIGFFVVMAVAGARVQSDGVGRRPNVRLLYVSLIAGEWGLVYYVWKAGLRRTGTQIVDLIGGKWVSPRPILLDGLLALTTWVVWRGVAWCWFVWFGMGTAASISRLLPNSVGESMLWVLLSISAGFSEELVFRGYLQRQLTALTGSVTVALLLQSALFGIAHGYQGWRSCMAIAVYGALFTMLALWRRSLRPGMTAHAWTDIVGGLLR